MNISVAWSKAHILQGKVSDYCLAFQFNINPIQTSASNEVQSSVPYTVQTCISNKDSSMPEATTISDNMTVMKKKYKRSEVSLVSFAFVASSREFLMKPGFECI